MRVLGSTLLFRGCLLGLTVATLGCSASAGNGNTPVEVVVPPEPNTGYEQPYALAPTWAEAVQGERVVEVQILANQAVSIAKGVFLVALYAYPPLAEWKAKHRRAGTYEQAMARVAVKEQRCEQMLKRPDFDPYDLDECRRNAYPHELGKCLDGGPDCTDIGLALVQKLEEKQWQLIARVVLKTRAWEAEALELKVSDIDQDGHQEAFVRYRWHTHPLPAVGFTYHEQLDCYDLTTFLPQVRLALGRTPQAMVHKRMRAKVEFTDLDGDSLTDIRLRRADWNFECKLGPDDWPLSQNQPAGCRRLEQLFALHYDRFIDHWVPLGKAPPKPE